MGMPRILGLLLGSQQLVVPGRGCCRLHGLAHGAMLHALLPWPWAVSSHSYYLIIWQWPVSPACRGRPHCGEVSSGCMYASYGLAQPSCAREYGRARCCLHGRPLPEHAYTHWMQWRLSWMEMRHVTATHETIDGVESRYRPTPDGQALLAARFGCDFGCTGGQRS